MSEALRIPGTGVPPLLKWAGGKRGLLQYLLPLVPSKICRYFEPFVGGGALFFALAPSNAVLSDKNPDLVNCYVQVRDRPTAVIRALETLPNTKQEFYRIRRSKPRSAVEAAARFLYLVTLSFNGIHRQNRNGHFNVPYGRKSHIRPDSDLPILSASDALKTAVLRCADFGTVLRDARDGDFAYLDPPYTVAHGNNGFIKYNAQMFSWHDQVRLAKTARRLADRGCRVIVSNADHDTIRELYFEFRCYTVSRSSIMAASAEYRRRITECIFVSPE